jgi:hypothetical protein
MGQHAVFGSAAIAQQDDLLVVRCQLFQALDGPAHTAMKSHAHRLSFGEAVFAFFSASTT